VSNANDDAGDDDDNRRHHANKENEVTVEKALDPRWGKERPKDAAKGDDEDECNDLVEGSEKHPRNPFLAECGPEVCVAMVEHDARWGGEHDANYASEESPGACLDVSAHGRSLKDVRSSA